MDNAERKRGGLLKYTGKDKDSLNIFSRFSANEQVNQNPTNRVAQ